MAITVKERDLMAEALDKGERVFVKVYGKDARMRKGEKEAARLVIQSGKDVPAFILKMVCMGLEYLFFCEKRQDAELSELLKKLASLCDYRRIGLAMCQMCHRT